MQISINEESDFINEINKMLGDLSSIHSDILLAYKAMLEFHIRNPEESFVYRISKEADLKEAASIFKSELDKRNFRSESIMNGGKEKAKLALSMFIHSQDLKGEKSGIFYLPGTGKIQISDRGNGYRSWVILKEEDKDA